MNSMPPILGIFRSTIISVYGHPQHSESLSCIRSKPCKPSKAYKNLRNKNFLLNQYQAKVVRSGGSVRPTILERGLKLIC